MKTIFSLFDEYSQAEEAFRQLVTYNFDREEMNVILAKDTAKNFMDVDQERIKTEKSPVLPDTGMGSLLDRKLGGEQGVRLPDVGEVYAAGELANLLTTTAAAPGERDSGMKKALEEFSVEEAAAEAYRDGIKAGGILLFIRTSNERAAQAAGILREQKGKYVAYYL